MEMTSVADSLKRCPERASILFIGSTGDGKSATINHLLNTDQVVAKTGSFEPETRATLEYLVTVIDHDNETSDLKLGIIDTPGVNDPRGIKQDACNLCSMKHFLKTHSLYSKCYPNLIFLVVSANEHRIDGGNSGLANTLRVLKELNVVDQRHPNVVAVVTFSCSVSYRKITRWQEILEGKKGIISRNICQALGVLPPVVLLENDRDSNDLEEDGDFTLLPNGERQPENLYKVCLKVLKDNEDHYGLSTFNACLVKPDTEKQYEVSYHKVLATDSSKNPISEVEQDYLNVLRGGTKDGKLRCKFSIQLHLIMFD